MAAAPPKTYTRVNPAYSKYETEGARGQAMVTQRLAYDKEMIAVGG